jgi:hypothetical protein
VVLYDAPAAAEAAPGSEEWARAEVEAWALPAAATPALFLPVRLLGERSTAAQRPAEVMAQESFDALRARGAQREAAEAAVARDAAADRAGYAALYRRHWQVRRRHPPHLSR